MRNSKVKGFTLIELIVVIAIIGVLAAILVPSMIGYVSESKLSTANANAKLGFENAATYCTQCEVAGLPVPSNTCYSSIDLVLTTQEPGFSYSKDGSAMSAALQSMMGAKSNSAGKVSVAIGSASVPTEAKWAKTSGDNYVGHYPGEATTKNQYSL